MTCGVSAAENAAAILQEAAKAGVAVMIPGALEPRAGRPVAQATHVASSQDRRGSTDVLPEASIGTVSSKHVG
jgi:hypothetical protein